MSQHLKSHRVLLGLFGPPLALVGLRWWLTFSLETSGQTMPPALATAGDPSQLMFWVAVGVALAALTGALVWWLMRKPADPEAAARYARQRGAVLKILFWLWVATWLLALASAWRSHANRLGLQTQRSVSMKVVAVQVQPASTRSVGGAKVYLDWPEQGGLHTVVLESPDEALLRKPTSLQLDLAPGRWSGWFVVSWRVPPLSGVDVAQPVGATPQGAKP